MSDINMVIFQGRLTRKPELRTTPSGVSVTDLSVASNRQVPKKGVEGEFNEFTTFAKVTLWNKMAERYAQRLNTGDMIIVQGRLVDDNFEKDGNKTSGRLKIDQVSQVNVVPKRTPASTSQETPSGTTDEPDNHTEE